MANLIKWVQEDPKNELVFWPTEEMKRRAWVSDPKIYDEAAKDPVAFWAAKCKESLTWFKDWTKTYQWEPPFYKWFIGGKINAAYNALDRHVETWRRNKAAIIWEPEHPSEPNKVLTYHDLYREVNKFANVLKSLGVQKGDRVGIYLPMVPEVYIAMLACARIGAVHSVVFSAFSGQSLKDRMVDAEAKVLVTADGYHRRGKVVNLKAQADIGASGTSIQSIVVLKRAGNHVDMVNGRDVWWHDLMEKAALYCEPEQMDSEDLLFILYTSGTTGKPKGIVHTTGGYLTVAYLTAKWDFDLHDDDVFWCTADIGWVTGHTYGCYGPLLNGATIICYEGALDYPSYDRWWEIIEKYAVTVFYTAPTAIRMILKWGNEWPQKHNLTSLRLLGTVGEPINKEAWLWYFKHIGGERCPIIDTWWQTETGATLINSLPGIGPFIPTVAGRSFPGTAHDILDETGQPVAVGEGGYVVQKAPLAPGMLRTVYRNPQCYKNAYYKVYGPKIYYTGDGAIRWDTIGNFRFTGRVDDIMKVAGHRLSTAEIENVLAHHAAVADCAVVAAPHDVKGEVPIAFVVLKEGVACTSTLKSELIQQVAKTIGPIAKPEKIIIADAWPKTQSGKTMRRVLKALVRSEHVGDTTTLQNHESIEKLKRQLTS